MADKNDILQYPFMFSPDQWLNKYSPFPGKPIPPTQFYGTPTDAFGRPIPSFQDAAAQAAAAQAQAPAPQAPPVTLNSNPMELRNAALTGQPGAAMAYGANFAPQGSPPGITQMYGQNFAAFTPTRNWSGNATQAAPAAAARAGPDMTQAYLNALSNPGRVVTPGATVPQSAPPSAQSGVLQQFLANWKPSTGAGGYSNQGFFDALRGQV